MTDRERPRNTFRRETRAPSPRPPAGTCDTHFHAYGDQLRYPWAGTRLHDPQPDATFEELQHMHRVLGVDRGVYVQPTAYGTDYRFIIDLLAANPNYRGTVLIDESTTDAQLAELHAVGVRAARFNFRGGLGTRAFGSSDEQARFARAVARLAELGWHIKIRTKGEEILEHADLFRTLRIPAVLDSFALLDTTLGLNQPAVTFLLELLRGQDNWWVMLSNADRRAPFPWDGSVAIAQAFIEAAPDRMIWATDWPHNEYRKAVPNDADLLEVLYRYAPDESDRQRILVDNPARLYDFPS
jgi:predicted TIM-barrel fold metal-dependent hydrolase